MRPLELVIQGFRSFGERVEIDWRGEDTTLELRIQDAENGTRIRKRIALSELQPARK